MLTAAFGRFAATPRAKRIGLAALPLSTAGILLAWPQSDNRKCVERLEAAYVADWYSLVPERARDAALTRCAQQGAVARHGFADPHSSR